MVFDSATIKAIGDINIHVKTKKYDEALNVTKIQLSLISDSDNNEFKKIYFQSMWKFINGLRKIVDESNFESGQKEFTDSHTGFSKIKDEENANIALALASYSNAIINFQNKNYKIAKEIFDKIETYLESAGEFSNTYKHLIDHFRPEAFFVGATSAILDLDYPNAKILCESASKFSHQVAEDYYNESDPDFHKFKGLAHYYKSFYLFHFLYYEFSEFGFQNVIDTTEPTADTFLAINFFKKSAQNEPIIIQVTHIATAFSLLIEILIDLSITMNDIMRSTFKADPPSSKRLKEKISLAKEHSAKSGEQSLNLLRFCIMFENKISNLEKLARPNKKDFGKFSGIIACSIALPIFFFLSYTNYYFQLELTGKELITRSFLIALFGGFGSAAIKFKNIFLPE